MWRQCPFSTSRTTSYGQKITASGSTVGIALGDAVGSGDAVPVVWPVGATEGPTAVPVADGLGWAGAVAVGGGVGGSIGDAVGGTDAVGVGVGAGVGEAVGVGMTATLLLPPIIPSSDGPTR